MADTAFPSSLIFLIKNLIPSKKKYIAVFLRTIKLFIKIKHEEDRYVDKKYSMHFLSTKKAYYIFFV